MQIRWRQGKSSAAREQFAQCHAMPWSVAAFHLILRICQKICCMHVESMVAQPVHAMNPFGSRGRLCRVKNTRGALQPFDERVLKHPCHSKIQDLEPLTKSIKDGKHTGTIPCHDGPSTRLCLSAQAGSSTFAWQILFVIFSDASMLQMTCSFREQQAERAPPGLMQREDWCQMRVQKSSNVLATIAYQILGAHSPSGHVPNVSLGGGWWRQSCCSGQPGHSGLSTCCCGQAHTCQIDAGHFCHPDTLSGR